MLPSRLSDEELAFRLATKSAHVGSDGWPMAELFVRRPRPMDADGISVSCRCDYRHSVLQVDKCYGLSELLVESVRSINKEISLSKMISLSIDILADAEDHANIVGVPYAEENPAVAERVASLLRLRAGKFSLSREDCKELKDATKRV